MRVAAGGTRADETRNSAELRPLEPPHGGAGQRPRKSRVPAKLKAQKPQQGDERSVPSEEPSDDAPGDNRTPPPVPPDESEKAIA